MQINGKHVCRSKNQDGTKMVHDDNFYSKRLFKDFIYTYTHMHLYAYTHTPSIYMHMYVCMHIEGNSFKPELAENWGGSSVK